MNEPVKRATRRASSAKQAQQALQSECSEASVAFIAKPSAVERVGPLKMQLSRAETDCDIYVLYQLEFENLWEQSIGG